MKIHKSKIIFGIIIITVLTLAFLWDGNTPSPPRHNTDSIQHMTAEEKLEAAKEIVQNKQTDIPATDILVESEPKPEENNTSDNKNITCSISVRCDTILNNLQYLKKEKQKFVPDDGIIYENPAAVIYEGESVFNVLIRELKKNKIHYEFEKTPAYNSVYIEGIGNLYEYDCGDLSGWLYKVNGQTPGCGCSQYILKNGDKVEFVYSCNLGIDVGGYKEISEE